MNSRSIGVSSGPLPSHHVRCSTCNLTFTAANVTKCMLLSVPMWWTWFSTTECNVISTYIDYIIYIYNIVYTYIYIWHDIIYIKIMIPSLWEVLWAVDSTLGWWPSARIPLVSEDVSPLSKTSKFHREASNTAHIDKNRCEKMFQMPEWSCYHMTFKMLELFWISWLKHL